MDHRFYNFKAYALIALCVGASLWIGCFRFAKKSSKPSSKEAAGQGASTESHASKDLDPAHGNETDLLSEEHLKGTIKGGDASSAQACVDFLEAVPTESYFHILQANLGKKSDGEKQRYFCAHAQSLSAHHNLTLARLCESQDDPTILHCAQALTTIGRFSDLVGFRKQVATEGDSWLVERAQLAQSRQHRFPAQSCVTLLGRLDSTKKFRLFDRRLGKSAESREFNMAEQLAGFVSTDPHPAAKEVTAAGCLVILSQLKTNGLIWNFARLSPAAQHLLLAPMAKPTKPESILAH